MLIKSLVLCLIGISGGFIVGGGIFAFITMIGTFPRLADRTNTAKHIKGYENAIISGGIIGNMIVIFDIILPIGSVGLVIFGLFSGIYVGCLAMALAESLKVMPVFVERIKLRYGMAFVIFALALGKGIGSLYQFW